MSRWKWIEEQLSVVLLLLEELETGQMPSCCRTRRKSQTSVLVLKSPHRSGVGLKADWVIASAMVDSSEARQAF